MRLFLEIIYNFGILIAISIIAGFVFQRFKQHFVVSVLQGLLFGIAAIIGMLSPVVVTKGLIFDGRSVMISMAGLFYGPVAAVISALMAIILRSFQGGVGTAMGVSVILASAAIGIFFHYKWIIREKIITEKHLLLFGVIVHLAMLICTLALPAELVLSTLSKIWVSVLITYPVAGLVIGKVLLDASEHWRTKKDLEASEAKYRILLDLAPDAFFHGNQNGDLIDCNNKAAELTGYSKTELSGKNISQLFTKKVLSDKPLNYEALKAGKTIITERELIRKDGVCFPVEMNSNQMPDGTYQSFFRDISERKKLLEAVQQSNKLESIGVLAGGIAHDFNNLLAGIFGYIGLARAKCEDENLNELLNKAYGAIERAKGLTQQLLTFSKGGEPVKKNQALVPFIEETVRFALSGSSVSARFDIAPDLLHAEIDKNQVAQVIDNIVINAKEAMPNGGTISVQAENLLHQDFEHPLLKGEAYIRIRITDQGVGIPKEIINQIFDPFFTTKSRGHGLGLAMSYSIIKKHGGIIEVDSTSGKGSNFNIFLPASTVSADTGDEKSAEIKMKSSGKILVMDDEEMLREIVSKILTELGYEVMTAPDGETAIEIFNAEKNAGQPFKALIFDLTIQGGMGGREAIEKIRLTDREVIAFVSSGYSSDPVLANPKKHGFTASISKPFTLTELREILHKYL